MSRIVDVREVGSGVVKVNEPTDVTKNNRHRRNASNYQSNVDEAGVEEVDKDAAKTKIIPRKGS